MLRLVLSPRWIMWHVLTLGAMVTCGFLSAWQWHRAGSAMGSALNVGYGIQWPIFAVFFGVMWWRFLRMELRALREAPGAEAGTTTAAEVVPPPAVARNDDDSPFRRTPRRAAPVTEEESPGLAEYNRMLAALAERDARSG